MLTVFVRTVIVYLVLTLIMRIMGKRQIGELELADLVTTLLISEIAALPITNPDIPVLHALTPMVVLLVLETLSSVILFFCPKWRSLVSARPTVIIQNGRLLQSALRDLRYSLDELMSEIRQQGLTELSQVDYAILEKNGVLTVLPKPAFSPPTAQMLGLSPTPGGLMHIVYSNGEFSAEGLALIGHDRAWLERKLQKQKLDLKQIYCVTANQSGQIYWISKEEA